jgi:uncharacterized membrane protein
MQEQENATRQIVFGGMIAAAYAVLVYALAPFSFGPIQFRVAALLGPAALLNRYYVIGLAVGVGLSNIISPFGWYDWFLMPIASFLINSIGYRMRKYPLLALLIMAILIAIAVAYFPLYLGGGIPFYPTVFFVFVSQAVSYYIGWFIIWRQYANK